MSYTITNKRGGKKRVWSVGKGCYILEFDKDNKAVIEDKAVADKLKKLGYAVAKNSSSEKEVSDND